MTNLATTHSGVSQDRILILIASGFEELPLAHSLSHLRGAGLTVSLVSTASGLISGLYGLTIRPDLLIDRALALLPPKLVIVSGGHTCATSLMADPRVHQLITITLQSGGYVAAPASAQLAVRDAGVSVSTSQPRVVTQGRLDLDEFVRQLANLVLGL